MELLNQTIKNIEEISIDPEGKIRERFDNLAIPKGSLGRLEEFATIYASIKKLTSPKINHKAVFTMAGDEGVSAFPQAVTGQMVRNFLNGDATINLFARHVGARVIIVDCGVNADFKPAEGLRIKKVGYGTANMLDGPAMSYKQAVESLEVGIEVLLDEIPVGLDIIATGDMGIANTTPSSAIIACLTGMEVSRVTGKGTGLDNSGWEKKVRVIEKVLKVNKPDSLKPLEVLAKVGGFEIGAIAGLCLAAASRRIPVLIDGFVSTAAALIATAIEPKVNGYLIASHISAENGHLIALEKLGKRAIFDLNLRLGEGTGAVLGLSLVEAGVKILSQTATFSEACVSRPDF